ncbi:MAG: hypothetical protein RL617_786 [Pseudomonadota bacterium]|jgi:hypothetical protein
MSLTNSDDPLFNEAAERLNFRAKRAHRVLLASVVCLLAGLGMHATNTYWLPPQTGATGLHASFWVWLGGTLQSMAEPSLRAIRIVEGWMSTGVPGLVIWGPIAMAVLLIALIDLAMVAVAVRRLLASRPVAGHFIAPHLGGTNLGGDSPALALPAVDSNPTGSEPTLAAAEVAKAEGDSTNPNASASSEEGAAAASSASQATTETAPTVSDADTAKPLPSTIEEMETSLFDSEKVLEQALSDLKEMRQNVLNLSLDPDGPNREEDLAEARAALDRTEEALAKVRGQQHSMIAGLVNVSRHVR